MSDESGACVGILFVDRWSVGWLFEDFLVEDQRAIGKAIAADVKRLGQGEVAEIGLCSCCIVVGTCGPESLGGSDIDAISDNNG